jgi:hypothetical protein
MKKIVMVLILSITSFVQADNGVFVINDVCDGLGCFPGDTGGFPVTITASGSYQLTSNIISGSTTLNIIEVNANNVTIDLNGFSIIGPKTCTGAGSTLSCNNSGMTAKGIVGPNLNYNTTVKNGTVEGFSTGIDLGVNQSTGDVVENVTVRQNSTGIRAPFSLISNSSFVRNFAAFLADNSLISNSFIVGNRFVTTLSPNSTCSNVYIVNNTAGALTCSRFTNESTCNGAACP